MPDRQSPPGGAPSQRTDEQNGSSFTFPGWLGAASAISESGTWASLNVCNDHSVVNQSGLDPIFSTSAEAWKEPT